MKNRTFVILLIIESIICIIAALALSNPNVSGYLLIMQFPFAQLGLLLRGLSLSSAFGNVIAFIIYVALCAVPLVFALLHIKKRTFKIEDWLLVIMSGFGFYVMYMMINPDMLSLIPSFIMDGFGQAVLGGAFYSILIGYLVFKMLRTADGSSTDSLLRVLRLLLAVAAIIIVFSISYIGVGAVKAKLDAIQTGNTDPSVSLDFTNFFVVLRYVLTQLPVFMELIILIFAMQLCSKLRKDAYGEGAVESAKKLASFCKKTVVVILLCCITLNLLQIVFAGTLVSVDYNTVLPLDSIIIAFAALLLMRFFIASRELSQDNKMFI